MLNIITSAAALLKFLSLTTTATPKFQENIYTQAFICIYNTYEYTVVRRLVGKIHVLQR